MDPVSSPKSFAPYDAYKSCAQGICNVYCPQWCNYPPPLDSGDDSGTTFSPLIISVIGILASAFLLVSYYAIITKYCRRRGGRRNPNVEAQAHLDQVTRDHWLQVTSTGLDEGLIKSITVFKYNKKDGLVEGTECSVCLNEFQENESLRLLPKCCHAFHPNCIDTWLKSHSNCPLCRANAAPVYATSSNPPPAPSNLAQTSSSLSISALETRRLDDLVLVVDEVGVIDNQQFVVTRGPDPDPKNPIRVDEELGNREIRNDKIPDQGGSKSSSLRTISSRGGLMVADVLQMNEDDDQEIKVEVLQKQSEMKVDSSEGNQGEESKSNNGKGSDSKNPFH